MQVFSRGPETWYVFIEKHFPLFLETTSKACPATQAPRSGPSGAMCKTALREPCSWAQPAVWSPGELCTQRFAHFHHEIIFSPAPNYPSWELVVRNRTHLERCSTVSFLLVSLHPPPTERED